MEITQVLKQVLIRIIELFANKRKLIKILEETPSFKIEFMIPTIIWNTLVLIGLGFFAMFVSQIDSQENLKLSLIFIVLISVIPLISPKSFLLSLALIIHPNKEDIVKEVQAFREINNIPEVTIDPEFHNNFEFPSFEDLETYCEKHFHNSRAFKQLLHKYCVKDDSGIYDKSLLVWKQAIPFSLIDESSALELLKSIKIPPVYIPIKFFSPVDSYFKDYSVKQIKNIFNSNFCGDKYIESLRKYMIKNKAPFPVFPRMTQLIDYLDYFLDNSTHSVFNKPKIDLTIDSPTLVISRISSSKELYLRASEFRNCSKSYLGKIKNGTYDFYILRKENPIMFNVDKKGKLIEAKYKLNADISSYDMAIIKEHIKRRFA